MRLVWHIVRKDFRRCRFALLLWWACLAYEAFMPGAIFAEHLRDDRVTQNAWYLIEKPTDLFNSDGYYTLLVHLDETFFLLDLAILGVITVMLIWADRPTNDRAHWHTLPVGRVRMLLAKVTFFALFFAGVPALIEIVALAHFDFAPGDWLAGTWPVVSRSVGAATVVAALALLNRRVAIIYALIAAGLAAVLYSYSWWLYQFATNQYVSETLVESHNEAALLLGFGTVAGFVALMFLSRRLVLNYAWPIVGALLAISAFFFWPVDFHSWVPASAVPMDLREFSIQVKPDPSQNDNYGLTPGLVEGNFSAIFPTLQPGEAWLFLGEVAHLDPPVGDLGTQAFPFVQLLDTSTVLKTAGYGDLRGWWDSDDAAKQDGKLVTNLTIWEAPMSVVMKVRPAPGEWSGPAKWTAQLFFGRGRLQCAADLPLVADSMVHDGPFAAGIADVALSKTGQFAVQVVVQAPAIAQPFQWFGYRLGGFGPTRFALLWNPQKHECLRADSGRIFGGNLGPFSFESLTMNYSPTSLFKDSDAADKFRAWLTDAHLLLLSVEPEQPKQFYSYPAEIDQIKVIPPGPRSSDGK